MESVAMISIYLAWDYLEKCVGVSELSFILNKLARSNVVG
jgi:hypothetical protein